MPATSLQGKKVVVIGGSSGIGLAVAEGAAALGANVVIGSSSGGKLAIAVDRVGHSARGFRIDVTDEVGVAAFFDEVGPFDHLAFTAGDWNLAPMDPPDAVDLDRFHESFAVRFFGALRAVKYAARAISSDGSITLTSGALSYHPYKGMWNGSAMAGAVNSLAIGLAMELAPVRVNTVSPGFTVGESGGNSVADQIHAAAGPLLQRLPKGRAGRPAEVAQGYLYLMAADYTTGQEIRVDGGYSLV
jgi:NAD(P)-dependent dehydrogenase (short-subunit alcohol dehydrogenase family)